jgi:hypothetical protein
MDVFVEPLYMWIVGLATLGFAVTAVVGYLRGYPSAPFFTFAAAVLSFAFFVFLPRARLEILLICGLTAITAFLVDRGVRPPLDAGEDTLTRRPR